MNRKWRLYLDTSVFGGCFDTVQGWAEDSRRVIDSFLHGQAVLLSSELLEQEIVSAPASVRDVFLSIPNAAVEKVYMSAEMDDLAHAYVRAGVIGKRWLEDCQHVAAATVARADAIVSWNFKHIVRLNRIKGYNQVNVLSGYGQITVVSPKEVNFDE
jgi:predicted nucleic acid-binding protein